ncbi:MAG: hypothetical protein WCT49_04460 [Candidatus Paceibacterota bacterium]|jgi:hypothetical protein|nr:hypothetical protein [Candidatus Paceibacterota bacterium]
MFIWIFIIVMVWWISKHHYLNQAENAPLRAEVYPAKKEISEDFALEAQTKFENRMKDVFLPDAINGKEIYIYKKLMSVWYAKLSSENRYDDAMVQKFRADWLEYMNALRDKSTFKYLSSETTDKEKAESYRNDEAVASKKVFIIEEAFAALSGKEGTDELARVRALDDASFSKGGEFVPEGFELNLEGKIQPKKKRSALFSNFFKKKIEG